jgi:tetratricopeptide (TPR) repeat protein
MKTPAPSAQTALLFAIVVGGLVCVVLLARWIDARRVHVPAMAEQEKLYLSGNTVRRMSLSFNGLAADWYWMRSLQYVGRKIMSIPDNVVIDDVSKLDFRMLAPLLDAATTLDPQFIEPYQYAAVVLPSIDLQEAIRITNKGITANPNSWRLYQHLGYIYWQQHDYKTAGEIYDKGSRIPGAPSWFKAMSARMAAEGGSRDMAREIYGRMYEEAPDATVKEMARRRLLQIEFFDQRDVLRQVLSTLQKRNGHCPESWRELEPAFRSLGWRIDETGAPLDPSGAPYLLNTRKCDIALSNKSEVPVK